jgi:arsenate reductase (glutaredoxin)
MRLFYNADCSKSNAVLDLLKENGQDISLILYCENPPGEGDLRELIDILENPVSELVRRKEPVFQKKYAGVMLSTDMVVEILLAHPEIMERPILVVNDKAIIARPPERVLQLLKEK